MSENTSSSGATGASADPASPAGLKAARGSRSGTAPYLVIRRLCLIPSVYILHAFLIIIKWHFANLEENMTGRVSLLWLTDR